MSDAKVSPSLLNRLSTNKKAVLVTLLLLVLLGGLLRFQGLTRIGPYFVDQGFYTLGACWYHDTICLLLKAIPQWIQNPPETLSTGLSDIFKQADGQPMALGRPLHNLLGAVPMFFVGYQPYLGNMVSAVFGTLSLIALFFLYRKLYGPPGSLAATALLALMGIHVYYSRNFLPEADSTFFVLVALIFYLNSREAAPEGGTGWIALCGFTWGVAVVTSDRWLAMFVIIWILEAHLFLREKKVSRREFFRRLLILNVMLLPPILAFGIPYLIVQLIFWANDSHMPFSGYLQMLVKHVMFSLFMAAARFINPEALPPIGGMKLSDFLIFPYINIHYNGLLYFIFLVAGFLRALWNRRQGDLVILACFLVPVLFFQSQAYHCMRHYSITFPFIAILMARGLFADRIFGSGQKEEEEKERPARKQWQQPAAVVLLLVTLASGFFYALETWQYPYGYREASDHIIENLPHKVLTSNQQVFRSYLGVKACKASPMTLEQLTADYDDGFRYLAVDMIPVLWEMFQETGLKHDEDFQRLAIVKMLTEHSNPIAEFANPGVATSDITFEVLFHYKDAFMIGERIRSSGGDTIRIYEIPDPRQFSATEKTATPAHQGKENSTPAPAGE